MEHLIPNLTLQVAASSRHLEYRQLRYQKNSKPTLKCETYADQSRALHDVCPLLFALYVHFTLPEKTY